jgi:hypothetical protein
MHALCKNTLAIVIALATSTLSAATEPTTAVSDESLAEAFAAADRGEPMAAYHAFSTAAKDPGRVNGHLYYDLGVTAWQTGRKGEGIAALLAARRFLPRDPDVAADLAAALAQNTDRLEAQMPRSLGRTLVAWLEPFTPRELGIAAAATLFAGGFASLIFFRRDAPRRLRRGAVALAAVGLVMLALFSSRLAIDETWGAVVTPVAAARTGPGEKNTLVFELHEGAPVRLAGPTRDGYRLVELSDGKRGWMAATDIGVYGTQPL